MQVMMNMKVKRLLAQCQLHRIAVTGRTSGVVTHSGAGGGAVTGQKRKKGTDDEGVGLRARCSRK
ncbi:hypothetical protein M427DRAFT_40013 [Gonapodya prolifera JEL478]|uniref:Uncharacterized protein n=1 Tax=Gonapodya prolifera (strain JEL478) TaxID=1344416 RepID=A0A138ZW60_GONPJ|nr:hypothetical protein M427DRAFT_40013 [Gonapodya prolifera JEL478]|eukprot:KXS08768.1 hypothetical protein M427DRAFT_40013 [Gonapodya prolifera JEL478]